MTEGFGGATKEVDQIVSAMASQAQRKSLRNKARSSPKRKAEAEKK